MNSSQSLPPSYFEALYQTDPDPWKFATSEYEAQKYEATIAALPQSRYQSALEIGGSIGVLTQKLAQRCDSVLSIDVSQIAQNQAIETCRQFSHIRFELMNFPHQSPEEKFDLILLSEVGYYWCPKDLQLAQQKIFELLNSKGSLLLVHWLPKSPGYPLTGDEVHDAFLEHVPTQICHLKGQSNDKYRLDLFEKI
jgi:cyclopropane fatty-acyl-phospholipid synthase-like methyltransferase